MREQALPEMREVSVGVSRRRDALVHLDDMHVGPGHVLIGECSQHLPRGVTPADSHHEAAARPDGLARLRGGEGRPGERDRIDIGQSFDLHDVLIAGFCQPPAGEIRESTSLGPQVPGSYSNTGVPSFSTGSTIRHASST